MSLWFFSDRIISRFIERANTYLATPVEAGEVEISLLRDFPKLTISLRNVSVEDSHPEKYPLFTAKRIALSFNLIDLWNGNYEILALEIINSNTSLRYNHKGISNFRIFKSRSFEGQNSALKFNIKKAVISGATVSYSDEQLPAHHEFQTERFSASVGLAEEIYHIVANGDLTVQQLAFDDLIFLPEKKFRTLIALDYDAASGKLTFLPSEITAGTSAFDLNGFWQFSEKDFLDVKLSGRNTDITTILSFLPEKYTGDLNKYQSEAQLRFGLRLSGSFGDNQGLAFTGNFSLQDGTMTHPETGFTMEKASVKGTFSAFGRKADTRAELKLDEASGLLNNQPFTGKFIMRDFDDPWVDIAFRGNLDSTVLSHIIPDSLISNFSGMVEANLTMTGRINDLKVVETVQQVRTGGTIAMKNLSADWGKRSIPFRMWNGTMTFNGQDLILDNITGKIGSSDLNLSGRIRGLVSYLLLEDQSVGIDTKLKADFIDLDQLLDFGFGQMHSAEYKFDISPLLYLRFHYDAGILKYRRFRAMSLSGDLSVKGKIAQLKKNRFNSMGGSVELDGLVDARKKNIVSVVAGFKTKDVRLDSTFYVFEDFGQEFITQKHLKGKMTSDIRLTADLDRGLKLIPEKLEANAGILIKNGELNDFEPLQGLSKYLDDKGLRKLRFADLKNDILIKDRIVIIPGMEIKSNLTAILLSGKHSFDQSIDYRVVIPLSARKKVNQQEAGDAYVEEKGGKAKLFLKITGTSDDYEISYDGAAVRKKIAGEFKDQVKSFKESFKAKETQKKKATLKEDDFFDWENPD